MDKEKEATGNNANAANMTVTSHDANSANGGFFTLGDTVTVNGAIGDASGAKIIPGTFSSLGNNGNSDNTTLTVMSSSSSSSSSSSNNLALPPAEGVIVVNPALSLPESITKNFTFHDKITASCIKMKLGVTVTFENGISASIPFYENGNDTNLYQLAEDLIGKPFSITLTEEGNFETHLLSGETTAPEIEHDA